MFSHRKICIVFCCGFVALLQTSPASAQTIVSHTSTILVLPNPPTTVADGTLQDATHFSSFKEQQGVTLASGLAVDITTPGSYNFNVLSPATVPAGTVVDSFYMHTAFSSVVSISGSITFAEQILGIQTRTNTLANGDPVLGDSTTIYGGDGYESDGDTLLLSNDLHILDITSVVQGGDNLRVITLHTSTVPEPGTLAILTSMAIFGAARLLRRRK